MKLPEGTWLENGIQYTKCKDCLCCYPVVSTSKRGGHQCVPWIKWLVAQKKRDGITKHPTEL